MKTFHLNENQRLHIEAVLSAERGTYEQLQPIGALLAKIRIPEADRIACELRVEGNSMRWNIRPNTETAIELEDEEARRLLAILKAAQFTSADLAWLAPILA